MNTTTLERNNQRCARVIGGTSTEPLAAFKTDVETHLAGQSPSSTYADALTRFYPKDQNLDFIPGSLPYETAADLSTYDYIPSSLRHTIEFTVKDDEEATVLSHTVYVSDLADKELLMTYDPATQADQDTLDTFDTIYDVVPLSLVAVKPMIKVNGVAIATGSATTTLGEAQSYTMEFSAPTRTIGGSVTSNLVETINRSVITGNTDAIALDTDRVVPPELRPQEDTETTSFVANQVLHQAASDFLYRLQDNQNELGRVVGGDFTNVATRATVFNGIDITYSSSSEPYSFDWKGLRIDSSSKVKYFYRFGQNTTKYFKEFTGLFGLQASQEESNIFEDNFGVQSVATVKGLKLVSSSTFPGITLEKITLANEGDIDTLTSISTSTRDIFHAAVEAGRTVYTPSAPVTYGIWSGLFYISIDFNGGNAGYIIGEGLNGGYTGCNMPGVGGAMCNWTQNGLDTLVRRAVAYDGSADISASSFSVFVGQAVNVIIQYLTTLDDGDMTTISMVHEFTWTPDQIGNFTINGMNGATGTINIAASKIVLGNPNNKKVPFVDTLDELFINNRYISTTTPQYEIPADLLKSMAAKESGPRFNIEAYRYEPCNDARSGIRQNPFHDFENDYPWANYWIDNLDAHGNMVGGTQVNEVKNATGKRPWEFDDPHNFQYPLKLTDLNSDGKITVYEIWEANDAVQHYTENQCVLIEAESNFAPQLILSASYGIGQELYPTAVTEHDFDQLTFAPPTLGQKSNDIKKLFIPEIAIPGIVERMKALYSDSNNINLQEGCTTNLRTWTVLTQYNGGVSTSSASVDYANKVCTWWDVDKIYAPHIFDNATGLYIPHDL